MTRAPDLLLQALNGAGIGGPWSWEQVAIVRNVSALLPAPDPDADSIASRGFNLVLLSAARRPEYYCKVRHAGLTSAVRETDILVQLTADSHLGRAVPVTHLVEAGLLHVQVTEYIAGASLASQLRGFSSTQRALVTEEILSQVSAISGALGPVDPAGGGPQAASLAERAEPALAYLGRLFPGDRLRETIGQVIALAGDVPVRPQHGDLWPGNVLRGRRGWVIIDFELFGQIDVPLYDQLHFLRTAWNLLRGDRSRPGTWLEAVAAGDPRTGEVTRATESEAARLGLTGTQVLGLIAFYLLDSAYRLLRRGVPGQMSDPFRLEVEQAATQLGSGRGLWDGWSPSR